MFSKKKKKKSLQELTAFLNPGKQRLRELKSIRESALQRTLTAFPARLDTNVTYFWQSQGRSLPRRALRVATHLSRGSLKLAFYATTNLTSGMDVATNGV